MEARKTLLDDARRELPQCDVDVNACRQVAEKAWGYVAEEADTILGVQTRGPERHKEREALLLQVERKSPEEEPNILRDYERLKSLAHGACFYEKNPMYCDPVTILNFVDTAEDLVERIRRAKRAVG